MTARSTALRVSATPTLICMLLAAALLAACAKQEAAAPAPAAEPAADAAPADSAPADAMPTDPAPAEAAPPAESTAPTTETPAAATAPVSAGERLAAAPAQSAIGKWQAGRNYTLISPPQPTDAGPGKVEIIEVFWYGCSHCYELDPYLESWKKNKPANVEFVRVPVIWGAGHKLHARLFYTLKVLGKLEALHSKAFDTVHRGGNPLLGNDEASTLKVQRAWAEANGVDGAAFEREWTGFAVSTAVQRAEQLTRRYQVAGVPSMVVGGKYQADVGSAGGHSQLLTLLNDLAAAELRR